jgi:N utilization substance protein B
LETNLCYLLYFKEVINYSIEFDKQQQSKFIEDNKEVSNISISKIPIIQELSSNLEFEKYTKKYKTHDYLSQELVKKLYLETIKMTDYTRYIEEPSKQNESNFILSFFKRILFQNDELTDHLESSFPNIDEDSDLVHFVLRRIVKNADDRIYFAFGFKEWKKEDEFATELIKHTLSQSDQLETYIEPKLKGWEKDRVHMVDMLLLKMAIIELLNMPSIPIKVTINEYIDLSKMFSSFKSKEFINGILENLKNEFLAKNMILKTGRGLE